MGKEYSDYLKFIDDALELAKSLPMYFSRFSNKIYNNHQKLAIYVFMQKLKTTTRGIVAVLRASSDLRLQLGLYRVPSHSTIVRFVNRIRKDIHKVLRVRKAEIVAVDASGFELEEKSYYFRTVWNHDRRQKVKRFMKLSIAVDVIEQRILTYKIRKSRAHDTRDFKPLLENIECNHVLADRGYDSKSNRKFVILKMKAKPHIPYRKMSHAAKRGTLILPQPDKEMYGKRSMVENIFFCIKRKYGSNLRNRKLSTQKVELISKIIAYNVDRMQRYFLLILEGCTSAIIEKSFIDVKHLKTYGKNINC